MFPSHYTDAKTRNEQAMLRYAAEKAMNGRAPFDCALVVRITGVFIPPSSWSEKKKSEAIGGLIRHTIKPDKDNLEKLANDALNKIVWIDDSRIVDGITSKWYGAKPFYRIEVWRWSPLLV